MVIYKRDITIKLVLLRLFFFTTLPTCIYLFSKNNDNLAYFLTIILLFVSAFTVSKLIVMQTNIIAIKYYLCGLLPIKHTISDNNIPGTYLFQEQVKEHLTETGTWLDVIVILFPVKKKVQGIKLKIKNKDGSTRDHKLVLNKVEFELISKWVKERMVPSVT